MKKLLIVDYTNANIKPNYTILNYITGYQYTDKQSGTDSESSSSSSESSDESITNIEAINGFIMPTLTIKKGSDHAPNRLGIDYNRRKSNFSGVRDRRRMPSAAGNCRRKSYFVKNDPSGSFLKLSKINEVFKQLYFHNITGSLLIALYSHFLTICIGCAIGQRIIYWVILEVSDITIRITVLS